MTAELDLEADTLRLYGMFHVIDVHRADVSDGNAWLIAPRGSNGYWLSEEDAAALVALLSPRVDAISAVRAERLRQDEKWGEQNWPDGTGPEVRWARPGLAVNALPYTANARDLATVFTRETDAAAMDGLVTWRDIFLEEVAEALAEDDPQRLRTELVQVAAVAIQWIEGIDRRQAAT